MINRRHFTVAASASAFSSGSKAQSEVLRLIVGFPAGGVVDVVAREIGNALKGVTGRTVIVENRPGAGGRLAVMAVTTTCVSKAS